MTTTVGSRQGLISPSTTPHHRPSRVAIAGGSVSQLHAAVWKVHTGPLSPRPSFSNCIAEWFRIGQRMKSSRNQVRPACIPLPVGSAWLRQKPTGGSSPVTPALRDFAPLHPGSLRRAGVLF